VALLTADAIAWLAEVGGVGITGNQLDDPAIDLANARAAAWRQEQQRAATRGSRLRTFDDSLRLAFQTLDGQLTTIRATPEWQDAQRLVRNLHQQILDERDRDARAVLVTARDAAIATRDALTQQAFATYETTCAPIRTAQAAEIIKIESGR